jgi:hypothetical protein
MTMPAVPCPSCGNKMSGDVVVCPHCGKRRGDGGMAKVAMSRDEVRALITVTSPPSQDRGILATVVLPHPETTGAARNAELALTVACLPLVISGALLLGFGRLFGRRRPTSEAGAVISMAAAGGLGLAWWLSDYGAAVAIGVTVVEIVLLGIRARVRVRSSRAHRLMAVEG